MNDRGVEASVVQIGDSQPTPDVVQVLAPACEGQPATRTAVAGAKIMFQATLMDRKNEGSSSAQQLLRCRQRHRNSRKSRRASDSARDWPEVNPGDNQDVAEPNQRSKTTFHIRRRRPHFRGHSVDTAVGERQRFSRARHRTRRPTSRAEIPAACATPIANAEIENDSGLEIAAPQAANTPQHLATSPCGSCRELDSRTPVEPDACRLVSAAWASFAMLRMDGIA